MVKIIVKQNQALEITMQHVLNPCAVLFQIQQPISMASLSQEMISLIQAITNSPSLNCPLVPEPTTFTGDPQQFVEWKISLMVLIGHKPLPANETMLYLKHYLAGEAHKDVEGFSYTKTESTYQSVFAIQEGRYESPFVIWKAFKIKLLKWPKIAPNDLLALCRFFLRFF